MKRKEQLHKEKIKHNLYYMNRWNIVREKRKDIEQQQREEERQSLHVFWWARQIQTQIALQTVFDVFDNTRTEFYQNLRNTL